MQHVVDEARAAGIEHFIFVTGRNKAVIEDHFDIAYELDDTLASAARRGARGADAICRPPAPASFTRQQAPLGLGHAVWCAREIVGDEPFALLLPDMLHYGPGCLAEMIEAYAARRQSYRRREVPDDQTHQYGIVGVDAESRSHGMVEKPKGTAPSNLQSRAAISCSRRSSTCSNQEPGAGGEIQLTDSMIALSHLEPFYAVRFDGEIYDAGSKIGFLTANVAYALDRGGARSPVAGGVGEVARAITSLRLGSAAPPDRCWRCSRSCGRCSSDARG